MYKRLVQGFTMVELMIVIAIIGIIAVAVLSAINPIEQINKGRDTRTRSDASEMLNAMERMYATDERYPFFDSSVGNVWAAGLLSASAAAAGGPMTSLQLATALTGQSELKNGFDSRIVVGTAATPNSIQVYKGPTADQIYVCFRPSSAQFQREANKKCITGSINYTLYELADTNICSVAIADAGVAAAAGTAKGNLLCLP